MSKYTPGPWRFIDFRQDSANAGVMVYGRSTLKSPVAEVFKNHVANARLIAAAPDLLEALREYHRANRLHHDEDARLYDLSEAAIAKAEGR